MKKYTKEMGNGYKIEVIIEDNVIRMGAYDDEEGAYGILYTRFEEIDIWELAANVSQVLEDAGYYETGGFKMTREVLAPIVYLVNQHGKEVTGGGGYVESLMITLEAQEMLRKDTEGRRDIIDDLIDKPWVRKFKKFQSEGVSWYITDLEYEEHDVFVVIAEELGKQTHAITYMSVYNKADYDTLKDIYPNRLGEMLEQLGVSNVSFRKASLTLLEMVENKEWKYRDKEKGKEDESVTPDVDSFERFLSSLAENMRKDPKMNTENSEEPEEDLENIASSLKADVVSSIKELIDKNIEENNQLCGLLEKLDQPTDNSEDERRVIKEVIDYFMKKITCLVDDEETEEDPDVVTEDVEEEDNGISEQTREEILQMLSGNCLSNHRLRCEINPEIWKEAHIDSSTQTQSDLWFPDGADIPEEPEEATDDDVTIHHLNFIADSLEGLEKAVKNIDPAEQDRLLFALGRLNGIIHKLTFDK